MSMVAIRRVAWGVLFAGWLVPLVCARLAPARLGAAGPQAARLFTIIAGVWAVLAVIYVGVLAARLRRAID